MIPERFAPVLAELGPLAETFHAAGHRLYLVGGAVRDLLVGSSRAHFDLDLTTDARPPQVKSLLDSWGDAVWTQGERFGTIGAHRRRDDGTFRTVEVTTFRSDAYVDDSRKPHDTAPTSSQALEGDGQRRHDPHRQHGARHQPDGRRGDQERVDADAAPERLRDRGTIDAQLP